MVGNRQYQFSAAGTWADPRVETLRTFARESLAPYLGAQAFRATVTRGGPPAEQVSFSSIEEWLSDLETPFGSTNCSSSGSLGWFSLTWTAPAQLNASLTVDETHREAGQALWERLQAALHVRKQEWGPAQAQRSSASAAYRPARELNSAWLDEAMALLRSGGQEFTQASYRLAAPPQVQRRGTVGELKERLEAKTELLEWNVSIGSSYLALQPTGTVYVTASAESDEKLLSILEELRIRLGLMPLDGARLSNQSVTRQAFFTEHPTAPWFDRLSAAMPAVTGTVVGVNASLRTAGGEELLFRTVEAWRGELEERWDRLAFVQLGANGAKGSLSVRVDLVKDLASLSLNLTGLAGAPEELTRLMAKLELREAPPGIYRYNKFGRTYRIKKWLSNEAFGRAVLEAVRLAFDGRPVTVVTASVSAGSDTAVEEGLSTVGEFAKWFDKERPFELAALKVEGFGGRHLRIEADRADSKFRVLGDLPADRFDQVDELFGKDAMFRSNKKDVGEESAGGRGEWLKTWLPSAVAILVAVLSALVSLENGTRADMALTVWTPEEKAEIRNGSLDVVWQMKKPRLFGPASYDHSFPADVEVAGPGGVQRFARQPGAVHNIHLAPGDYRVTILPVEGPSEMRHVVVREPRP